MEITKINDYIFKISIQKKRALKDQEHENNSFFEWYILRMDYSSAETDGLIYFDFLTRNESFLKKHLTHYPQQAYEDLSWSVDRMKRLSSAHNYFVFVKSGGDQVLPPSYLNKIDNQQNETTNEYYLKEFLMDKLVVGVCGGFTGGKTEFDSMEVGYALDEKYQSHGIITNTLRFIIEKAFREVSTLLVVKLVCNDQNVKSAAVAHRLGFSFNQEESDKVSKEENASLHCFTMSREQQQL